MDITTFDFEKFIAKYRLVQLYTDISNRKNNNIKDKVIEKVVHAFSSPQDAFDFAFDHIHNYKIRIPELEAIIKQDKELWLAYFPMTHGI